MASGRGDLAGVRRLAPEICREFWGAIIENMSRAGDCASCIFRRPSTLDRAACFGLFQIDF